MNNRKTIYKVVRIEGSKRVSAMVSGLAKVSYSTKNYTKGRKWLNDERYHITAFKDANSAYRWIDCEYSSWMRNSVYTIFDMSKIEFEIYECNYRQLLPILGKTNGRVPISDVGEGKIKGSYKSAWPYNTVMVKELRLKKRIATYHKGIVTYDS